MLAATVTIPVAVLTVMPAGSTPVVIFTFPGFVPMVTERPFKVSLVVNAAVEPPVLPLMAAVVSVTASTSGELTVILLVTVLQFVGFETSQMVYVIE